MRFRPLGDCVVIRQIADDDTTRDDVIIVPDGVKEKTQEGEVVAVGTGTRDENGKIRPLELRAGDLVLFGRRSGSDVRVDGEDLLIMKASDVMGVIEGASVAKPATWTLHPSRSNARN